VHSQAIITGILSFVKRGLLKNYDRNFRFALKNCCFLMRIVI